MFGNELCRGHESDGVHKVKSKVKKKKGGQNAADTDKEIQERIM